MNEEDFNQGMLGDIQHKQQHIIKRFPRVNAEQFRLLTMAADNGSIDSILNRPFVIEKALQSWGWNLEAFSLNRLQSNYGNRYYYLTHQSSLSIFSYTAPFHSHTLTHSLTLTHTFNAVGWITIRTT